MLLRAQDNTELFSTAYNWKAYYYELCYIEQWIWVSREGEKKMTYKDSEIRMGIESEVRTAEQCLKIWEANDLSPRTIYPAKLWIKDY